MYHMSSASVGCPSSFIFTSQLCASCIYFRKWCTFFLYFSCLLFVLAVGLLVMTIYHKKRCMVREGKVHKPKCLSSLAARFWSKKVFTLELLCGCRRPTAPYETTQPTFQKLQTHHNTFLSEPSSTFFAALSLTSLHLRYRTTCTCEIRYVCLPQNPYPQNLLETFLSETDGAFVIQTEKQSAFSVGDIGGAPIVRVNTVLYEWLTFFLVGYIPRTKGNYAPSVSRTVIFIQQGRRMTSKYLASLR